MMKLGGSRKTVLKEKWGHLGRSISKGFKWGFIEHVYMCTCMKWQKTIKTIRCLFSINNNMIKTNI